jgi:hypothetical protein
LHFYKKFETNGKLVHYAAVKDHNTYFATGYIGSFNRGSWDEFVLALISGDFPVSPEEIDIATAFEPMTEIQHSVAAEKHVAQNYEEEKQEWPNAKVVEDDYLD